MNQKQLGKKLNGNRDGWETLPEELKLEQIRELILSPYWNQLPLSAKQRWLDQLFKLM